MDYGRLHSTLPASQSPLHPNFHQPPPPRTRRKLILLSFLSIILIAASAVSATLFLRMRQPGGPASSPLHRHPTQAISKACATTRYPNLCLNSLLGVPGATAASQTDLVHISFNLTLQKFGRALVSTSDLATLQMDQRVRSAYDDCLELLDDSVDDLTRSLLSVSPSQNQRPASTSDVKTWLSTALTNHDTCTEGFSAVAGPVKTQMLQHLTDLAELVSNCLAIFSASNSDDFAGVPIQNKRRLLADRKFPAWMGKRERRLLDLPVSALRPDIVVSRDGNGTVKTIAEAIKKAPEYSTRRTVIYIKAGTYQEKNILKVGRKKWNLMFVGDGKGVTVISGNRNIFDNITTFHTATFAATGQGFIARDITFQNNAGPQNHQAVALRVGADHAVVYRCNVIGYQDTLYVHSNRQFYRECDIYGTVDFIFGNAAVVFQNCSLYARKPMAFQKNTVTAQNRKDPNQNSGISIHDCRVLATPDLTASKGNFSTYLGRPWKLYSRTVVMMSYIGDHVHPRGWLEWNTTFALDTLYYGEYMNYGPGGAIGQRVTWPGYRVITSVIEATKFSVAQFISGSSWLPSTGVAFLAGLSE
uniref:Pectinesterase n=1 Tax=Kalanchoe fedtschenkoi TaxID=63787 RepID=A0A7N0U3V5_KALFE